MKHFQLIIVLFFLFGINFSSAQNDSLTLADTDISILTCRSGDALYSTFGHTAIRVKNTKLAKDKVYNYGLFSFDTPNFYMKFMRGQLPYLLGRVDMSYFLGEYHADKRSVLEQKLLIDNQRKRDIIAFLENNVKPENREYAYDFFYDNCATRVVDVYDIYGKAGDSVRYSNAIEDKTFRDLLKENLKNLPWSEFGIDIVIGARADQNTTRRHQMFLPEYLMENLTHATYQKEGKDIQLASEPYLVLDFEKENDGRKTSSTPWPLILMLILLVITILINLGSSNWSRIYNKFLLGLSGVFGLFLLFMWFGTNHGATRDNWNVLWFNPLLLLLFTKLKNSKTLLSIIGLCLLVSGLNCLFTFLPQFFHLAFLPIIGSIGVAMWGLNKDSW